MSSTTRSRFDLFPNFICRQRSDLGRANRSFGRVLFVDAAVIHNEIKVLDLFSGIGGFSLGLERAGHFRTIAFCEREPFCQAVLKKNWPDTPIYDDVRTINTDGLGRVDLICGGFPCQPWSVAGQQRGAEDDRDLWPEMVRLVEELQPRWLIGENVRGFVNEPMGLQRSLSDLESIGYQAVPFIIPACAVDAPHRRDRVWIVADSQREGEGRRRVSRSRKDKSTDGKGSSVKSGGHGQAVADSFCVGLGGGKNARATEEGGTNGVKQSWGCGEGNGPVWLPEPSVGRVANGIRNRTHRLRALGNAVVPQVVEKIGRAIIAGEQ
jgi:DNA (cytosine-5)-methyltransferase 1